MAEEDIDPPPIRTEYRTYSLLTDPKRIKRVFRVTAYRKLHTGNHDHYEITCVYLIEQTNYSGGTKHSWIGWRGDNSKYTFAPNDQRPHNLFCIYINSIMYLGPMSDPTFGTQFWAHDSDQTIREYWQSRARRQLGTHIYVSRTGNVEFVNSFIQDLEFYVTKPAKTHAIYPVVIYWRRPDVNPLEQLEPGDIRYTFNGPHIRGPRLSLGLRFRSYSDGIQAYGIGHRCYSRFQNLFNPISAGNVFELTEDILEEVALAQLMPPNGTCFAIYVCSGAKLSVMDDYHQNSQLDSHNRSLLQAGAVVVVETGLRFSVPQMIQTTQLTTKGSFKILPKHTFTIDRAFQHQILTCAIDRGQVQNPVLFLGANNSEYDSICWVLNIARRTNRIGLPDISLTIPDGGHIEAIEEWADGMQEILARHQYERLYESSVRMSTHPGHLIRRFPNFVAPQQHMLERILGVGNDRSVSCDIRRGMSYEENNVRQTLTVNQFNEITNQANAQPLPTQYNFKRFVQYTPNQDARRPTVPLPYPPIYFESEPQQKYCLPTHAFPGKTFFIYTEPKTGRVLKDEWISKCVTKKRDHYLTILYFHKLHPDYKGFEEYEMERLKIDTDIALCDGINIQMGVDGWLYGRKAGDRLIGKYVTRYYYPYKWERYKSHEIWDGINEVNKTIKWVDGAEQFYKGMTEADIPNWLNPPNNE